jgi:hypothetical protein
LAVLASVTKELDPTHDRRHMLMVGAAALRLVVEDEIGVEDGRRLLLAGALAHDFGRVLEYKLVRQLAGQVLPTHGYLSYLVVKKALQDVEEAWPEDLLAELYYSVAFHTGRPEEWDLVGYIGQGVQRADREQMLNLEMVAKTAAYEVLVRGYQFRPHQAEENRGYLTPPGRVSGNDLFQYLEFFARRINFAVGRRAQERWREYRQRNLIFLWLAETPAERAVTFALELAAEGKGAVVPSTKLAGLVAKSSFEPQEWQKMQQTLQDSAWQEELARERASRSGEELTRELLAAPELSVTAEMQRDLQAVAVAGSQQEQEAWCQAVTYVLWQRREERADLLAVAAEVEERWLAESLEAKVARLMQETL